MFLAGRGNIGPSLYDGRAAVQFDCEWRGIPPWRGQDLRGRRLLLHPTPKRISSCRPGDFATATVGHGAGDTLMDIRWARAFAAAGATVGVDVRADLHRTAALVDGVSAIVTDWASFAPDYQIHFVMAGAYGTCARLGIRPADLRGVNMRVRRQHIAEMAAPYLRASHRADLGPADGMKRIGLCWAGSAAHNINSARSAPLKALSPLGKVPGVRWYSLQVGDGREQLASAPFPVTDAMDGVRDFNDAAAIIDALDMVVSVDTSIPYLSAGMGKRTMWMIDSAITRRHVLAAAYPCATVMSLLRPGRWCELAGRLARYLAASLHPV